MTDINRQVAEQVMGFEYTLHFYSKSNDDAWSWYKDGRFYLEESDFNPSENISDAWLVVEKMRELKWDFELKTPSQRSIKQNGCKPAWATFANGFTYGDSVAETAQLAICKAALEAVRKERCIE